MVVLRSATAFTRIATAFDFDAQLETATLRPPQPFQGEAGFQRESNGKTVWTGSISVPILGGGRIALGGHDVVANMVRGIPPEE